MDRVSTYNLNSVVVSSALNVQATLANAQVEEASGLQATDYGNLGGAQSYQLLNLETELNQAQSWSSEASTVGDRTQAMYSAIGQMTSCITKLQSNISAALSSSDTSSLSSTAQSLMDQLASAMNTQENGRYLFSGSNISTAPVDMAAYASASQSASTVPAYDPTAQDFSYYKGDNTVLTVQTDASTTVSYGLCAGTTAATASATNPASTFELAIRATEATIQAASSSPASTSMLKTALTLANSALTQMSDLQETVAATSSQLTAVQTNQTNYATLLQGSISSLKDVDVATVTTQISQYQTQLQASYLAVASITKLNLATYI